MDEKLVNALKEAIDECNRHNFEYHHVTREERLAAWEKLAMRSEGLAITEAKANAVAERVYGTEEEHSAERTAFVRGCLWAANADNG